MIISTGQRTDIPAFYAEWFANRIKEGYVCVRNPYNRHQVSKYRLDNSVVDAIGFCTKNPEPMFPYMDLIKDFGQYWFVTLTSYGSDIEPCVPDKHRLITDFQKLSDIVGVNSIGWRYDPIFLSDRYNKEYHLKAFAQIAKALSGYTRTVVISFIDLYQKVRRNFPEVKEVDRPDAIELGKAMIEIASSYGMTVKPCAEGNFLEKYGADCSGCMTIPIYEKAIGHKLIYPPKRLNRSSCACYLACDIGEYDTCRHFCKYCYANNDINRVIENSKLHDPASPFLVGGYEQGDIVHEVVQKSWIDPQISLFDL